MKTALLVTTLLMAAILGLTSCKKAASPGTTRAPFSVVEASIPDMQQAMAEGRVTSEELVKQYLIRIATYENVINAAIAVNPPPRAMALDTTSTSTERRARSAS